MNVCIGMCGVYKNYGLAMQTLKIRCMSNVTRDKLRHLSECKLFFVSYENKLNSMKILILFM